MTEEKLIIINMVSNSTDSSWH